MVGGLAVGEYSVCVFFHDEVVSTALVTIEREIAGVEVKVDPSFMSKGRPSA